MDQIEIRLGEIRASTSGDGLSSKKKVDKIQVMMNVRIRFIGNHISGVLDVYFKKEDWNTKESGLIYTDSKFVKDVNEGLKKLGYNHEVEYSEQVMQGNHYVNFDLSRGFIEEIFKKLISIYNVRDLFHDRDEIIKLLKRRIKEQEKLIEKIRIKRKEMIDK